MPTEGVTLPATAWEQAVFVSIFVIFTLALLGALMRWFSSQAKEWRQFVQRRDVDWQSWMDRAEKRSTDQLERITDTLDRISQQLDAHDKRVDDRIDAVKMGRLNSGENLSK